MNKRSYRSLLRWMLPIGAAFAAVLILTSQIQAGQPQTQPRQEMPTATVDPFYLTMTPGYTLTLTAMPVTATLTPTIDPALFTPTPPPPPPEGPPEVLPTVDATLLALTPTPELPTPTPIPLPPQPVVTVDPNAPAPTPNVITLEQLRSAQFIVPSISVTGTVQLSGGSFVNSTTGLTVVLTETLVAMGDVSGDGVGDAAAVVQVTQPSGAVGYDLVLLTNQGPVPVALAAIKLGTPVIVDRLRVEKGAIWVDLRIPNPNEPNSPPSLPIKRIYVLRGTELVELPAAAYGQLFPYRYGALYGYVNVLGEFVVAPQFAFAGTFTEGLALVSYDGQKFGFINRLGQVVVPIQYQFATPFAGGISVAGVSASPAGEQEYVIFIDRAGQNIFGETTFSAGQPFSEGMAAVKSFEGQFGYIDLSGEYVIQPQYDYALPFSEGLAPVMVGDKVGYINRSGATVVEPQYDAGDVFSEGLAAVALAGKVGYIDHSGAFAIEPAFDRAERFSEGHASASAEEREFFIDAKGSVAIAEPTFSDAQDFTEGLAAVKVGEVYGYVNSRGDMAIEPQFTVANPFDNGLAVVETAQSWGVIAYDGTWLVQLTLLPQAVITTSEGATVVAAPAINAGTEIVTFVPSVPDEIRQGACYAGSDLVALTTAWRCGVGSQVFDPCVLAADGVTVVCGADPATDQPGFALELTQPLPTAAIEGKTYPGAWLFQLESGEVCRYIEGTSLTIEGQRINYTCSDLTQLLGEIDKSNVFWTVTAITTQTDSAGNVVVLTRTPVTVTRAWMPALVESAQQNQ